VEHFVDEPEQTVFIVAHSDRHALTALIKCRESYVFVVTRGETRRNHVDIVFVYRKAFVGRFRFFVGTVAVYVAERQVGFIYIRKLNGNIQLSVIRQIQLFFHDSERFIERVHIYAVCKQIVGKIVEIAFHRCIAVAV